MANNELTLTTAGQTLIAKVQAGACKIKWTKAQIGSGAWSGDLTAATALQSPQQTVDITSVTASSATAIQVRVVFSNEDMATPFALRELGVFARGDTDPGDSDVLVGIMAFDNTAEIPAYNGSFALRQVFNLGFAISIASVATVELSSALATVKDISAEAERAQAAETNLQNRHTVTDFTISASGTWESVTVNGGTMYRYTQAVTAVGDVCPEISLGAASGTAPTSAEQAAYGLLDHVTADADVPCLYLYAVAVPASDFVISVKGVA